MFGAVDFYSQVKKAGLTPIIGCDILTEGEINTRKLAKDLKDETTDVGYFHLVLLARNKRGYHKLMKIVSDGYLKSEPGDTPVVPLATIQDPSYANDLVALSGNKLGEFAYLVKKIKSLSPDLELSFDKAHSEKLCSAIEALEHHLETIHNMVGRDNYYVELTDNNLPNQKGFKRGLIKNCGFLQASGCSNR